MEKVCWSCGEPREEDGFCSVCGAVKEMPKPVVEPKPKKKGK